MSVPPLCWLLLATREGGAVIVTDWLLAGEFDPALRVAVVNLSGTGEP